MQTTSTTPEYRDMTAPDGRHVLAIRIDRHHTHTAVTVITPMDADLNRSFPTEAEADAYLTFLNGQVAENTPLWQIEHNAAVLTSTSAALDHIDVELIVAVNAAIDGRIAATVAAQPDVADIVNSPRDGWRTFRQAATRTGKPTSQPMDRILDSAVDGYIPRSQDATSVQLIALHKRGKVVLDWQQVRGTRRIVGAWLAGQQPAEVAA